MSDTAEKNLREHKIKLYTTGGTIGGKSNIDKADEELIKNAEKFTEIAKPTIEHLRNKGVDIQLDEEEICNIDSSEIAPSHWKQMVDRIVKDYDDYHSFIISHGTNTMGYTSAALSFAIANANKPIIITGSQVPVGLPGSDAEVNINNAIRVAAWEKEGTPIKGVIAVFGSYIITGCRVKKTTEFDYDAFRSFGIGSLGRIGRIVNIDETNLAKHDSYLRTNEYHPARNKNELQIKNTFDMRIASVTEYPGMDKDILLNLCDHSDIKGIILRSFGAGDVNPELHDVLSYLKGRKIPIVITTQAPLGNANFQVNQPGMSLASNKWAIPAYDMGIESQTVKLAWLIDQQLRGEISYEQLCSLMTKDMRGEINVLWECGI